MFPVFSKNPKNTSMRPADFDDELFKKMVFIISILFAILCIRKSEEP